MSQRIPLDVNDNILFVSYLFYTFIVALVRLLGTGRSCEEALPPSKGIVAVWGRSKVHGVLMTANP